jgi:hypothetical protein
MSGTAPTQNDEKLFVLALTEVCDCLRSMSEVLQRRRFAEDAAARGGIAVGLERAAAHVRGRLFEPVIEKAPD